MRPYRFQTDLARAFLMPRLRALLPPDATLSVDGKEIFLPRLNPTREDLVRLRAFFSRAQPFMRERRDHVVHYDNAPTSRRTR